MKTKSLPKLTPITLRYARQLVSYVDDFLGEMDEQPYKLETYLKGEWPTLDTEQDRNDFWLYLINLGAVSVSYPDKKVNVVEYTDINQIVYFPSYHLIRLLDIAPVRELLKIAEKRKNDEQTKSKVDWDPMTSTLTYKSARHKFRQGNKGDAPKLEVFKELWAEQKCERTRSKGMPLSIKTLATRAELITNRQEASFTKNIEDWVIQLVKDIGTVLKEKEFPISIKRENNTYLMVVSE